MEKTILTVISAIIGLLLGGLGLFACLSVFANAFVKLDASAWMSQQIAKHGTLIQMLCTVSYALFFTAIFIVSCGTIYSPTSGAAYVVNLLTEFWKNLIKF